MMITGFVSKEDVKLIWTPNVDGMPKFDPLDAQLLLDIKNGALVTVSPETLQRLAQEILYFRWEACEASQGGE